MPAHIGIGDKLRAFNRFVAANTRQEAQFRRARKMNRGNFSLSYFEEQAEAKRGRREIHCNSYDQFRKVLDSFGPDRVLRRDEINKRHCNRTEWDLYLKPDSGFDLICRRYFEIPELQPMVMVLITHKSDVSKLKRIEAIPHGEEMRIIWSEA